MLDLLADKKFHTAIAHLISVYRAMLTMREEICPEVDADADQQAAVFEAPPDSSNFFPRYKWLADVDSQNDNFQQPQGARVIAKAVSTDCIFLNN